MVCCNNIVFNFHITKSSKPNKIFQIGVEIELAEEGEGALHVTFQVSRCTNLLVLLETINCAFIILWGRIGC